MNRSILSEPQSSFVGRAAELARLAALFEAGHRLVTVWGPGGVGKTRLALRHAAREPEASFCALAAARDADSMCARVAEALEVSVAGSGARVPPALALGRALAQRGPLLLVLDNAEQLVEEITRAALVWLAEAPALRILVTSRERLRAAAEAPLELAPMSLPGEGQDASASDAVALFVERATETQPGFALGPATTSRVAALVTELEGLPLAIELAAARLDVLGLDGLLGRLGRRLDVLGRGRRDAEPRQATLRATLEWSWELLAPAERRALARASVFRGGFSLAAAEAVLETSERDASVLDVLHSLRDKSLLVVSGDPVRFGMYEIVRELASEKLAESGEEAEALARHTAHYAGEARAHVAADRDNVLAVVRRCLDREPLDADAVRSALEAAVALDAVVSARGPLGGHIELLDRAIAAADRVGAPEGLRGWILEARGRAERVTGALDASVRTLEAARGAARAAGDVRLEATVLADLGVHHHDLRDVDRARSLYEEALARARELGDPHAEGRVLANLAALDHDTRRLDAAAAGYRAALAIFRRVGDRRLEGIHLANLGILEHERGRVDEALACYQRALAELEEVGDRRLVSITLGNLGSLHHAEGRLEEARSCHERALHTLRGFGDLRTEGLVAARLGASLAALGRAEEARAELERAERALERLGDRVALAAAVTCSGFLDLARAAEATRAGREPEAQAHLRSARARVSAALAPGPDGSPSAAELSDDVRLAIRLLERALAAAAPGLGREGALVIGPDAAWFTTPDGARQGLQTHAAMRRILLLLARHRERSPGVGLSLDDLREAGWPGEAMATTAATNRVHVALAHLRRAGLKPFLERRGDGYMISATLPIEWAGAD